jgi:hypothetical protein
MNVKMKFGARDLKVFIMEKISLKILVSRTGMTDTS